MHCKPAPVGPLSVSLMPFVSPIQRGFTLVELVTAILIMGILATTVILRMNANGDHAVMNQADQMVRDLSHVQSLAMGWNVRLRLEANANGRGYAVRCRTVSPDICAAVDDVPVDPATGAGFVRNFPDGVTMAPVAGPASAIDFDTLGRPNIDAVLITGNPARIFTLNHGVTSVNVTIAPVTGFAFATIVP